MGACEWARVLLGVCDGRVCESVRVGMDRCVSGRVCEWECVSGRVCECGRVGVGGCVSGRVCQWACVSARVCEWACV